MKADRYEAKAARVADRRRRNPTREARRQANISRMSRRVDYVPTYFDIVDGRGNIVRATYLGHKAVALH